MRGRDKSFVRRQIRVATEPPPLTAGGTGSIPSGGSGDQALVKVDGTDYNVTWESIDQSWVGLDQVDNTSDADKPVSTATQTALNGKQDLDSDLTAIAGLAPSNDDIIQRKAGAWTNRTLAQLLTDLNLGAVYQPLDSDLTSIAALSTTAYGRALLTLADAAALGALVDTLFLTPAEGDAAYQPLDSDLTAIAALSTTAYGRSLLALADATALAAEVDSFFLTPAEGDAAYRSHAQVMSRISLGF